MENNIYKNPMAETYKKYRKWAIEIPIPRQSNNISNSS